MSKIYSYDNYKKDLNQIVTLQAHFHGKKMAYYMHSHLSAKACCLKMCMTVNCCKEFHYLEWNGITLNW